VKSGDLDRGTLLSVIQPLMIHPRPKPRPPTFAKCCQAHKKDPEPTGPTATFVGYDTAKPVDTAVILV
jgi:hypothetical protein